MSFKPLHQLPSRLLLVTALLLLPACASNWPDPYKKPEPRAISAPQPVPEAVPELEPPMVETIPLPDEGVISAPVPQENAPAPPPVIEAEPEMAAIVALRGQAADSMAAGQTAQAAATIERALRIQPRNPVLWLDLAAIRFAEQEFVQTEELAKRALTYAASKNDVAYDAWILIANSRYARNDREGGERAEAAAQQYL
ncbi:MAG: hypothetical protein HKN88_08840 [Gammaproteobacteria bacterium]|nr:hypothetical protein [Gammaproteobacteria bacterium]NNC98160.1 hypothetical protein [Gammaproteobacteria bacterium]NNM13691.1 hypothetical protein [Gammaproteobacteria bacterium]